MYINVFCRKHICHLVPGHVEKHKPMTIPDLGGVNETSGGVKDQKGNLKEIYSLHDLNGCRIDNNSISSFSI